MAKFINKVKDFVFGEDEGENYEEEDYREDEQDESQEEMGLKVAGGTEVSPRKASPRRGGTQVYSINTNVQMQVVIIKPKCYEDAQEICDQIKTKRPVVVNLEDLDTPTAQRIMDFLSGTCYSLEGSIQRASKYIFVIAPENVDISGNFTEELKNKGVLIPWMENE